MNTTIEQLRALVKEGRETIPNLKVWIFTLQQELAFIENRKQEEYFLAMYRYVKELKSDPNAIIGPGRRWTTASHVCYTLGITNICLGAFSLAPIDFWGNDDCDTTMDIEVDEDTYALAFTKATEVFGYENVAQVFSDAETLQLEDDTDILRGYKHEQHGYAIVVCLDGIRTHFEVDEITDKNGQTMLRTKESVGKTDNTGIFRFNVIRSNTLTRIKRIRHEITKAGKDFPNMYPERSEYTLFKTDKWTTLFDDKECRDLPFFGDSMFKKKAEILFNRDEMWRRDLLTIPALYCTGQLYQINAHDLEDYKKEHGVVRKFDEWRFPCGFLFREDVCWYMTGWIGLTWKQSARIIQLMSTRKQPDTENLKHIYLHHGMDSGFEEGDLNRTWNSLFNGESRMSLPSMAHIADPMYQYAFLAMLKKDFPEEYLSTKNE